MRKLMVPKEKPPGHTNESGPHDIANDPLAMSGHIVAALPLDDVCQDTRRRGSVGLES